MLSLNTVTIVVWVVGCMFIAVGVVGLLFRRKFGGWVDRIWLSSNYSFLPQTIRSRWKEQASFSRVLILYVCVAAILFGAAVLGIGLTALS